MRIQWIIAALFLTAAGMTAMVIADTGAGSPDQGLLIGMPDPSAVWANEMGYRYQTRVDDQGGQYGVIILPDGTERDAWEAYREYLAQQDESGQQSGPMIGMPNPSAVWANEMGYQVRDPGRRPGRPVPELSSSLTGPSVTPGKPTGNTLPCRTNPGSSRDP